MRRDILHILRILLGTILLLIGAIGLILPVLQGWLVIFLAILVLFPSRGKAIVEKLKERFRIFRRRD